MSDTKPKGSNKEAQPAVPPAAPASAPKQRPDQPLKTIADRTNAARDAAEAEQEESGKA